MNSTNSLWTPDREVALTPTVQSISPAEMKTLEDLHGLAQRLGLVLICRACDGSFQGQNSGNGRTAGIACRCREIRTDYGNKIVKA